MAKVNLKDSKILLSPRMSEKAILSGDKSGVYVFEVTPTANKALIAAEVKKIYSVTPVRVHTAQIPAKRVFVRGKHGVRSGGKKAYVYLKKGDKIELL